MSGKHTLLQTGTVIPLTTVARVNAHRANSGSPAADFIQLQTIINMLSASAMKSILCRALKYEARSEYFDVKFRQDEFYVSAPPIDSDETITVRYNSDQPRDFTDSDDDIDSDYVILHPGNLKQGKIKLEYSLTPNPYALMITYTGGLGTRTCLSGTDGATGASGAFTAASGDFTNKGVAAGDTLVIYKGSSESDNERTYEVVSKDSATQLTVTPEFASEGESSLDWEVYTKAAGQCIVGSYEDIARAIDIQAEYEFRRQHSTGMTVQNVGGESITYFDGVGWLNKAVDLLQPHARGRW